MSRTSAHWRRRIWVWLPPAVALAVASLFLAYLESGVRARGTTLDTRLQLAERQNQEAREGLARLEALAAEALATRQQMEGIMAEKFATESGRFTQLIREIKQLAEHAGLDPRDIGYPEEDFAELGLVRRSFIFSVEGSYANLRAFLYLLELSPSYITVDQIALSELAGARGLRVSLRLSTFFSVPREEVAPPGRSASGSRS